MLGMGWIEIFVIVVAALLAIGPERLPEAARGIARLFGQIQRMIQEIRNSVRLEDLGDPLSQSHVPYSHTKQASIGDDLDSEAESYQPAPATQKKQATAPGPQAEAESDQPAPATQKKQAATPGPQAKAAPPSIDDDALTLSPPAHVPATRADSDGKHAG